MNRSEDLTNQELFSVAAGLIMNRLYDSFPCATFLERDDLLKEVFPIEELNAAYQKLSQVRSLQEMSQNESLRKTYLDEGIATQEHLDDLDQKREEQVSAAEAELRKLTDERERIHSIYSASTDFLSEEGLARDTGNGYRLTAKGFSALGYEFKDLGIEKSGDNSIALIKQGVKTGATNAIGEGFHSLLRVAFQCGGTLLQGS